MLFNTALYFLTYCFYYVRSTDVTGTTVTDSSLGLNIDLPVLSCHARHTGYRNVAWYKDGAILKNGTADLPSHILPLSTLLNSSVSSVQFHSPFELQGYYWCETDHTAPSSIHKYLFRMKEIHTFVGSLVAKEDSLGDSENLSRQDKIEWKKQLYETQMQGELFGFLEPPSVHVTNIKELPEGGLMVHFFLYVQPSFHPRKVVDNELVEDEDNYLFIKEFLWNETTAVDPLMYLIYRNWTDLLGIDVPSIQLRSTLGCYEDRYPMVSHPDEQVVWPYARIGEVVIPENACSGSHGLSVTRICTGSFTQGAKWGNPSGSCEKPPEGVTLQLMEIYNEFGNIDKALTAENLNLATINPRELSITDLHIAIETLKELSLRPKLNKKEIGSILSVVDNIIEINDTELIAGKQLIHLTSRILEVFENLLKQATNENKEIQISKKHLLIDTKRTETDDESTHILGLAVIVPDVCGSLSNGSIEFLTNNHELPKGESLAYFVLPKELVLTRESETRQSNLPHQVNMVFFKEWDLFQYPQNVLSKRNYKVLPTPVMYVTISGGPAWNLTDPVDLYFKDTLEIEVEDPVCVYYDTQAQIGMGAWSSEGCEYKGFKNSYHHCQCHHLSIFAVILSQNPIPTRRLDQLKLGTSVYVACGVSILALSLAVVLFVLSNNWRQTVDHSILFNLCLCYLICVIIIFISETRFARRPGCLVLALVFYYTIFTIFGWLLIQAIVYRLRFAKKTDVGEIPHFMIKTGISVWGVPVLVVLLMWISKDYPRRNKDYCWLTVWEVSKEALIPMGVLVVLIFCVYACATYSLTGGFKKDFLVGDTSSYNDLVVKFRVAFTIFIFFILTWLLGFFALQQRSQSLRILFSISLTLTAYYLALFFIFQEVSLWELCLNCKKNKVEPEATDTPIVQYEAASYNSVEGVNKTEK